MYERIPLAAVMVLTHFGRIKAAFIPCLLHCKGLVLTWKSCSLLPNHPHPKMWGQRHLHAGHPPFNGKDLLVLLHPDGISGRGADSARRAGSGTGNTPGVASPAQGRAGLCPRPAQSLGQEQSVPPAPGCPQGEQHPGATGLRSPLASLCRFSSKGFGPCSPGSCCTALGRAEQSRAEQQLLLC